MYNKKYESAINYYYLRLHRINFKSYYLMENNELTIIGKDFKAYKEGFYKIDIEKGLSVIKKEFVLANIFWIMRKIIYLNPGFDFEILFGFVVEVKYKFEMYHNDFFIDYIEFRNKFSYYYANAEQIKFESVREKVVYSFNERLPLKRKRQIIGQNNKRYKHEGILIVSDKPKPKPKPKKQQTISTLKDMYIDGMKQRELVVSSGMSIRTIKKYWKQIKTT